MLNIEVKTAIKHETYTVHSSNGEEEIKTALMTYENITQMLL